MDKKYFKLQLKKVFKIYPTILIITVMTIISIIVSSVILLNVNTSNNKQQKLSLGIVGDMTDSYLDIGLSVLENTEDFKFYFELHELDDEEDAIKALKNREISGYVIIPDGYIDSILRGRNIPAKYVTLNSPEGFGTIISSEIATLVSDIVRESQTGVYSTQLFCEDYNKNFYLINNKLMMKYINFILNRNDLYEVKTLGISDSLSIFGYYICGFLLIFILLWGISCSRIFTNKSNEYSKILNISGLSIRSQILCEYLSYLIVTLITLLLFSCVFGVAIQYFDVKTPEFSGLRFIDCIGFIIKILPAVIMITLMQMLIYELIPNTIPAVLMQFILTIILGYISGCFYPSYFFPEVLQKTAEILPIGAAFSYIRKSMTDFAAFKDIIMVFGYSALFYILIYFIKRRKITGDIK